MEILIIGCFFSVILSSTITYLLHTLFAKEQIKYFLAIGLLLLTGYYAYKTISYRQGQFIDLFYIMLIVISLSGFISATITALYLDYHKVKGKHRVKS